MCKKCKDTGLLSYYDHFAGVYHTFCNCKAGTERSMRQCEHYLPCYVCNDTGTAWEYSDLSGDKCVGFCGCPIGKEERSNNEALVELKYLWTKGEYGQQEGVSTNQT